MRVWTSKPKGKHLESRMRTYFAWHPVKCTDDSWYWLERILVREHYSRYAGWVQTSALPRRER